MTEGLLNRNEQSFVKDLSFINVNESVIKKLQPHFIYKLWLKTHRNATNQIVEGKKQKKNRK